MYGVREPLPGVVYPPAERLKRYVNAGALASFTLVEALIDSFALNAERVALASMEGDVTYAELDSITDRFAASLIALGLKPLDRVLFQSSNSRELIYAVVGCLKAGLVPVCTLAAHREREIEYLGCHADARAHIVQGDDAKFDLEAFALRMKERIPTMGHIISLRGKFREGVVRLEDMVPQQDAAAAHAAVQALQRDPFQVVIFQLSGGTTGVPKIIPRMQNDYLLNATLTIRTLDFRSSDVLFCPMPMIHNAAMICFIMPSLLAGSSFAIPADLTPESWGALFRAKKPTYIGLIRPLLPRLDAMVDGGLATLESVRRGWGPDSARLIRTKYGIPSQPMFGMSEGMCLYPRQDDPLEANDWTVGLPMSPFDEIRLVVPGTDEEVALGEVGEFTCRGPYTVNGYYNAPERNAQAFSADGFYRSGDLMVQKQIEGTWFYTFAGRTKDVVDRGAEKINCEEVESAVSTHLSVSGCAVVGMPDPVLGERVCAYIVPRAGAVLPSVKELGQHLQQFGLAKFKWPERVENIDTLPLTKVGKLDKAALREAIQKKIGEETAGTPQAAETRASSHVHG